MNLLWLGLLIALAIVEVATMGLTTIWFAGGALVAFVASCLNAPMWLQIALFIIVSVLLLIFTRPIAMKYLNKNTVKTNIDSIIGETAKVVVAIDNINSTGKVFVDGKKWTARSVDDSAIQEDELVTVVGVEGVKLLVKKKEEVA